MKVVDPSLYVKGSKMTKVVSETSSETPEYATLVLYAKRFEDLPIISKIGDIIRVHRATLRIYNNQRQFNANIYYNSSWALFSQDKGIKNEESDKASSLSYAHSNKNISFEKHEFGLLSNMRKWSTQYFSQYTVMGGGSDLCVPLVKAPQQKSDFDVIAKLTNIFEMDEYTNELALRDLSLTASQPSWHVLTLKLKFPNLAIGDVIRIRSASFDVTSTQKQMLLLSHYSNIMTFGENCKLAREIKVKVSEDKKAQLTFQTISEVSKDYHNMPPTPMIELFHSNEADPSIFGKTLFRVRFYVTKIEPSDVKEWVKGYDKKTKKF